jgi:methionyl-tRNA synthetase
MTAEFLQSHAWIILLLVIWLLPWKAIALWKSARRKDYVWFIILTLVNTVGLLEIIYIFLISKNKPEK